MMIDPAVEAAKRANESNGEWPWDTTKDAMQEAANEALKPIRELHTEILALSHLKGFSESHADGMRYVLHELAKLIYPESELYETEVQA